MGLRLLASMSSKCPWGAQRTIGTTKIGALQPHKYAAVTRAQGCVINMPLCLRASPTFVMCVVSGFEKKFFETAFNHQCTIFVQIGVVFFIRFTALFLKDLSVSFCFYAKQKHELELLFNMAPGGFMTTLSPRQYFCANEQ